MTHDLRISGIVEESIVDGPGLRFVLFTQGCPHRCQGCHNPDTHDPAGGYGVTVNAVLERFFRNPLLAGITFSGGEPFLQAGPLARIASEIALQGGSIITYTGYTCEQLVRIRQERPDVGRLLDLTDTLIDGPYVQALRNLELPFRGSANQRILSREDILRIGRRSSRPTGPHACLRSGAHSSQQAGPDRLAD